MLKSYTTSSGAIKARPGCPIVRLLRDPEDIFVPVLALDTEVHVLTPDHPNDRRLEFAGSVKLQDIVDAEIARQGIGLGAGWRNLRIVPDAENANNVRIVTEGGGPLCKVYGFDPQEAETKAKAIMCALVIALGVK